MTTSSNAAWFQAPGTASSGRASIQAAVSRNMVMRHAEDGYLWFPNSAQKMSFHEALDQGILSEEACEYIAGLPESFAPDGRLNTPIWSSPASNRDPLARFKGPIGDVVAAIHAHRLNPGLDEQLALCRAFEALTPT